MSHLDGWGWPYETQIERPAVDTTSAFRQA
jgi:hypothetical protein